MQRPLTTGFKSSLFPLYETHSDAPEAEVFNTPMPSSIEPMGINIYCPRQRVDDYEHLICQEVTLRRTHYNRHQPVSSVWWLGSPLQQFSPEAITELCFRLSSYFSHQREDSTRGMEVTPMELNPNNLALMKGLNFNAIKINIDASVASGDRSLSNIAAALQILADYQSFNLSCVIKFSEQSHANFIDRLLNLLEASHCTHIEVSNQQGGPVSIEEQQACQNQLARINQHFADVAWRACGNNSFFAPCHSVGNLQKELKLEAGPWGYLDTRISLWLGFGVAALSLKAGNYQYNTPSNDHYVALLKRQKPPISRHFYLPSDKKTNVRIIQALLCGHAIESSNPQLSRQLSALLPGEWVTISADKIALSKEGVINLSTICNKLFAPLDQSEKT
ncbi:hypothetical protein A9Q89_03600 [Gammaproteobacteria bacterium 53_120_T64]|nr:hypothetical protein A9Q89_03600 [Gammaproteobacteria bacterium 53_120_T64]